MLLTKKTFLKWNPANKKRYVELGYKFTKMGDEFEVDVNHLSKGSKAIVQWECDGENCDEIITGTYQNYLRCVKEDGKTYCQTCATKLFAIPKMKNTKLKNGKSFEDLCLKLNRQDLLDRWDTEKNGCLPSEVSYKSSKKRWFKCDKHPDTHHSELKSLNNFASGQNGSMECNQCNSFEQWCIDNNRLDVLARWDEEKNGCKPSEVSRASSILRWFKCDKHPEHHSELKSLDNFTHGSNGVMDCKQCNSIMQFCIDNNRLDELDIEKNEAEGLDLWNISYGSKTEVWFKCNKKDYHGSYKTQCNDFIYRTGCPLCKGQYELHPLDSIAQKIIDLYGDLYKIWNKELNGDLDPFAIAPYSKDIMAWFNCPDGKHEPYLKYCKFATMVDFRCSECFEPLKGKDHPNYKPELTDEERELKRNTLPGYVQFIKDVMKRDNYTCQVTGKRGRGNLVVHHLDGYNWCKEKRTDVDNGITLCEEIHKLFHKLYGQGDNTKEQFEDFLMKIECGEIDISNII